jgi:hypothetical protein
MASLVRLRVDLATGKITNHHQAFQAIATRSEKHDGNYLALVRLAAARL